MRHRILPVRKFGFLISICSLLLLWIGVVRGELGSMLWGGVFFVLTAILVLQVVRSRCRLELWLRRNAGECSVQAESYIGLAGDRTSFRVLLPGLPGIPVGVRLYGLLQGSWQPERGVERTVATRFYPLTEQAVEVELKQRGRFRWQLVLVCEDVLGCSGARVALPGEEHESLLLPHGILSHPVPHIQPRGGVVHEGHGPPQRSHELFETRSYHPGDDVRRIHWKQYAHSGNIQVRIGEEVPPPAGDVRVALYLPPEKHTPEYLDAAADAAAGILREFVRRGLSVQWLGVDSDRRYTLPADLWKQDVYSTIADCRQADLVICSAVPAEAAQAELLPTMYEIDI